jgi:diguanylate cyclase (GGDEF)-like protein/PAS domain S-box-containing protein
MSRRTHMFAIPSRDFGPRSILKVDMETPLVQRAHIAEVDFLRALVQTSDQAILVIDRAGTTLYASAGVEGVFGFSAAELVGQTAGRAVLPEDRESVRNHVLRMIAENRERSQVTVRVPRGDEMRFVSLDLLNKFEDPHLDAVVMIARDVTESRLTEKELRVSRNTEQLLANISWRFANSLVEDTERDLLLSIEELRQATSVERVILWALDDTGRSFTSMVQHHAPHLSSLDGCVPALPIGIVHAVASELFDGEWVHADRDAECSVAHTADRQRGHLDLINTITVPDAGRLQSITFVPMRVAGQVIGLLSFSGTSDQTELNEDLQSFVNTVVSIFANAVNRRTSERALAFQALHDPLTGLPNRSLLLDRLSLALARSVRSGDNVSVMLIDLDGFKDVNDTLGHEAGDDLLKVVAQRLQQTLRDADSISRLGGDEFVIVVETAGDEWNARTVAGRVVEAIREPISLGNSEVVVSGSVGLVIANASLDNSLDASAMLRKADIAMYRAKTAGRDRVEVFSDEMEDRIRKRFELLDDLRRAIIDRELIAWYQPIIDVASGRLTSFEALVRWIHPVRGIIPPLDFVELAEGSGVIHELGASVLDQAVKQISTWRNEGNVDENVTMSVNVSVRQLLSLSFVDIVQNTLTQHGLPAHLLHLELTESVFADRVAVTGPLLRLREIGVRVSIDDFGTGYSSLSYLRDLPIDCLKIDRSFVQGLGLDRRDNALVGAVVGMAVELGLEVIAEGVETAEQLEHLERLGCSRAQGFLFGRPAPAGDMHMSVDDKPLHDRSTVSIADVSML